jgi:radical SAM superfamily enzyme YgiQ (UPF0313 family)
MHTCSFGIESGDEVFRNDILRKNLSDDEIYRTVDILKSNNVEFVPFYIVGAPREKFTSTKKTMEMKEHVGGIPIIWNYERI